MKNIDRILIIVFYMIFRILESVDIWLHQTFEDFLYWLKCFIKGRKTSRLVQSKRNTISLHALAGLNATSACNILAGFSMLFIVGTGTLIEALLFHTFQADETYFLFILTTGLLFGLIVSLYYLKQDNLDRKVPILIRYEKRYGIRNFKIITWCYVITVFSPWILLWLISKLT